MGSVISQFVRFDGVKDVAELRPRFECDGKTVYPTKAHALAMLRRRHRGSSQNLYQCPHCREWHVGHQGPDKNST